MSGFDLLVSKSLDSIIRENLGKRTLKKIEGRLFEKFGINLSQAIVEFQKLDTVLREFFGAGTDGLEKKFFEKVASLQQYDKKEAGGYITLENNLSSSIILESLGDEDKKAILSILVDKSLIVSDILNAGKIPQTSGYRKINSLIQSGLLFQDGYIIGKDGRKIMKYTSLFEDLKIYVNKNKIAIKAKMKEKAYGNSSILQIMKAV